MSLFSLIVKLLITICVICMIGIEKVESHGRLMVPIARTSLWRVNSRLIPNYDDNQMFCGGFDVQYRKNNGKCGICGEDFSGEKPYERGGRLYTGTVVQTYNQNQVINVVVQITANHAGFFQFHLCNIDGTRNDATQECLNKITLSDLKGNTKVTVPTNYTGSIPISLRLPADLTCNHCVFQWKYNAGNSWGTDRDTGESCIGCGDQENFYGCSDVRILPRRVNTNRRKLVQGADENEEFVKIPKSLLSKLVTELKRLKETEKRYLASLNERGDGYTSQMEREFTDRRSYKLPSYSLDDSKRNDINGGVDDGTQISQETNHNYGRREFQLESYAAEDLDARGIIDGGVDDGVQVSQQTNHMPSFYRRELKLEPYSAEEMDARALMNLDSRGIDDGTQISQEVSHWPSFYRRELKLQPYSVDDGADRRSYQDYNDGTQISQETSHGLRSLLRPVYSPIRK